MLLVDVRNCTVWPRQPTGVVRARPVFTGVPFDPEFTRGIYRGRSDWRAVVEGFSEFAR